MINYSLEFSDNLTLEQAVSALDKGGMGILAFTDASGKLVGIITDGDIRRGFLRRETELKNLINHSPETMAANVSTKDIVLRLKAIHRRHMPIVDANKVLKRVFILDEFKLSSRENKVVVMAGGLGSRLGDLTKDTPKPMLKVGKKPMLHHLINMFSEFGFRKFVFCVNYKKEVIKRYFEDGQGFGVEIEYVEEQERLGTAGALGLAKNLLKEDFFVINADVIVNLELDDMLMSHQASGCLATMGVRRYSYQIPYGVIRVNGNNRISTIEEKPYVEFDINAGVYILSPQCLDYFEGANYLDMPTFFEILIANGHNANSFRIEDYWVDVGRKEDLYAVDQALSVKR